METHLGGFVISTAALTLGVVIGLVFGLIEERIQRRREKSATAQPAAGQPGSGTMRRTAYLLVALVVVQVLCPMLFTDGQQWSVSAGLLVGFGMVLYRGYLRKKRELGV